MNLAQQWAIGSGKTLDQAREEYDGCCIDFAGDLIYALGCGRLAYFDNLANFRWRYHAAAEIGGQIHDLWIDGVHSVEDFMDSIGAAEIEYPAEVEA